MPLQHTWCGVLSLCVLTATPLVLYLEQKFVFLLRKDTLLYYCLNVSNNFGFLLLILTKPYIPSSLDGSSSCAWFCQTYQSLQPCTLPIATNLPDYASPQDVSTPLPVEQRYLLVELFGLVRYRFPPAAACACLPTFPHPVVFLYR